MKTFLLILSALFILVALAQGGTFIYEHEPFYVCTWPFLGAIWALNYALKIIVEDK